MTTSPPVIESEDEGRPQCPECGTPHDFADEKPVLQTRLDAVVQAVRDAYAEGASMDAIDLAAHLGTVWDVMV
jgi:hypothetical protein